MALTTPSDCEAFVNQLNATDDTTTLGLCVHQLLEHAADSHFHKTAIICGNKSLTFGGLNAFANRFAHFLIGRGVRRGDVVGVAMYRSVELVAALLAVLKTGGAYVPIDPALPAERIRQMMDNANPKVLLADNSILRALKLGADAAYLDVDEIQRMMNTDSSNLSIEVQPEDLAYIIYTSGSTGKPKGVEISHGSVSNFLSSMGREPGCAQGDRLLAITTICFDMAVLELFLPLLCGATTVVAQTHEVRDGKALLRLIEQHKITIMQGTPATWQMLLDSGWQGEPRLTKVLCGGEALPVRLAERLLACSDMLWNMYGPTETTVYASIWRVRQGDDIIIGSPITNVRLYILDSNLSPVPFGSEGELCVGGAGVARGYRNNCELTRSRFVTNPFHKGFLYRTGDLARFVAPGKLSLMGRIDGQIKIRGYRIELGDIEAAITAHREFSAAIVVNREDRLVAYCVRQISNLLPKANTRAEVAFDSALRPWLAKRLPAYMVPAFFVEVEGFPMTLNGKIDRQALPDPVAAIQSKADGKPATDLEDRVLRIWSVVLGHNKISVDDNFFEIGGDSVRVVRVQQELENVMGRSISPSKLFEHYTIKSLALYLASTPRKVLHEPIATRQAVNGNEEKIAIISMACRLPGDVTTPEEFWELLESGRDAITEVPKSRWDANALYDANPDAIGKSYCRRGGFVSSVNSFDTQFFGISPREAQALDPMHYMMLETCWEGLERAGYTTEQLNGSQTGVFIGVSSAPLSSSPSRHLDGYALTGSAGGTISGRVSYQLGLEGPALTIDTACSSSLVTTHLACNALRQGECDMAVSGGVTLLLTPGLHIEFSRLRGMSSDGRCRAFAADAQGAGWGEGSAMVVLKRLSDAQRDGDVIHAVLRGTTVNHGGRSASLTTPSGPAQQRLVRSALAASALQPSDIDYIEAHGTGTRLGDPIEGGALAEVFGRSRPVTEEPLWVGSAKSNIGHTQAAAGLVGVLKVVLSMRNNTLSQTLHITEPTRGVDWKGAHMAPVLEKRPWPARRDRPRRAGVSAFGIGGTNAHVIVEEPPRQDTADLEHWKKPSAAPFPPTVPVVLSGQTVTALLRQAKKLQSYLDNEKHRLADAAFSLATTRNHFRHRMVLIARDEADLLQKLATGQAGAKTSPHGAFVTPHVAMLFTGQGSQSPGMGKGLATHFPVFREAMEEIEAHFSGALEHPLLRVMWGDDAPLLERTDYAQPALFALEVALWRLWDSWGVAPELVIGHSVGELAAAHVAGVMNISDACRLVAARGQLMQGLASGGMVSLEATAVEVAAAIAKVGCGDQLDIASLNTEKQTVVSGDIDAVNQLAVEFTAQGRRSKTLRVSRAFHSRHMDSILAPFQAVAETIHFNKPSLTIVSSLTGRRAEPGQLERPDYWVQQARHAVRFSDGIHTMANHGANIFLELGPRPVLCAMGAECVTRVRGNSPAWLPSLVPGKDDISVIHGSLAELHVRQVAISWSDYFEPFECRRVPLPTYAFQREQVRRDTLPTEQETARTNGRLDEQPVRGQCEIDQWRPIDTSSIQPGGSWVVLGSMVWGQNILTSLSRAGIQLFPVGQHEEAQALDGLICLWDSDINLLRQQIKAAVSAPHLTLTAVWVTRGSDETNSTTGLKEALRLTRIEYSELRLRVVDLGEDQEDLAQFPAALMLTNEQECAIRRGQVLVPPEPPKQIDAGWDLRKLLAVAPSEQHGEIVLSMVQDTVSKALGYASSDAIDANLPMKDVGIDSLTAVMLRNQFMNLTGLTLPATTVFDQPNLYTLSQSLLFQLQKTYTDAFSGASTSGNVTPAAMVSTSQIPECLGVATSNGFHRQSPISGNVADNASNSQTIPPYRENGYHRVPAAVPSPHHHIFSPSLGLVASSTSSYNRLSSALAYFSSLRWSSRLIQESSPTMGLLPGYGEALPFIPQCFNPLSPRHDQFIGSTLTRTHMDSGANGVKNEGRGGKTPPLRHVLCLIRPADPTHLLDPLRPITRVATLYALGDGTSGCEDILHGGLTATLLDESFSIIHQINSALSKTGDVFAAINVTSSLSVRYLAPLPTTEPAVCVTTWLEDIQGKETIMKGEVTDSKGATVAVADSIFVAIGSKTSRGV